MEFVKKLTKKLLLGGGALLGMAAAASAVAYTRTKWLVELAMDRSKEERVEVSLPFISGDVEYAAFQKLQAVSASKLEDGDCETVEIAADDGVRLIGHWHKAEAPKRVIIAMHGWRSSWARDFGMVAKFFHNTDCHVLYAEQRGQNNSGGEYIGFGLMERYDCLEWIKWVNEQGLDDLPIYLCGVSMGATTVLMAAGFNLPDNVHGIIADCGYTSPYAVWKHVAEENLHIDYDKWMSELADEMCRERILFSSKDYSTTRALAGCTVPVLFVHGTEDQFVPIEMTYENYQACTAQKRLLVVPGAVHGMSYLTDRERYEKEVLQFWQEFD